MTEPGSRGHFWMMTATRLVIAGSVLLPFLRFSSAQAETYLVRDDGTGDFETIQAAIDACVDGDVVELADGTFRGGGNREIDFLGKAITLRSQSGQPSSCAIDCEGATRALVFDSQEGSGTAVRSITIRNGRALAEGAGALCLDASPVLEGCVFEENVAVGGLSRGGAIACLVGASPSITGCAFRSNRSDGWGGAISMDQGSRVTFASCVFDGNSAGIYSFGGAIWNGSDCDLDLRDCSFIGNRAGQGSVVGGGGTVVMTDSHLDGNTGSAVRLYEGSFEAARTRFFQSDLDPENVAVVGIFSEVRLESCIFFRNPTAILSYSSVLHLTNCTLWQNWAQIVGWDVNNLFTIRNSIIGEADGPYPPVDCGDAGNADMLCCDVWGNAAGDWVGCIAGQLGQDGNISGDPLLCDPEEGEFGLASDSPCAPGANPACGLIGAEDVACGPTPAVATTWGHLRALFR